MADKKPEKSLGERFEALRAQVVHLAAYLQKVKRELATIQAEDGTPDHFVAISDQLDAIGRSTEDASEQIMEANETIIAMMDKLGKRSMDDKTAEIVFEVKEQANKVFEACAFQDLTGQRITKITKTMALIEETVRALVDLVGVDDTVEASRLAEAAIKVDAGIRLDGPQEGVSQADIDALFD